jgi:ferric-dicitrate binding protein FerR (iron transport regulator)
VTSARPDDLLLYDLFVRYWDNALGPAEREELEQRLATDVQARDWFHQFTLQTVAAADLPAIEPRLEPAETHLETRDVTPKPLPRVSVVPEARRSGFSRRRMMKYVGGGLAAGFGGVGLGWWLWPDAPNGAPRLRNVQGTVIVQDMSGKAVSSDSPIPLGGTVSTYGLSSSAVIAYPDGSGITLTGDSSVKVIERNRRLLVHRGAISASVLPQPVGSEPLTLMTSQVTFAGLSGVLMTLGEGLRATELLVHQGTVAASHPTGEPLAVVKEGESLTVWRDGEHKKQPISPTPEEFAWNLAQPLPEGWPVGRRELTPQGMPYVRPEFWPDPYYQNTEMHQIRSSKQWLHGFFRLAPDSVIRVRYWVDRPGKGQLCFCARTTQSRSPDTGMLEWNGLFGDNGAQEWQWLEVAAEEMLRHPNKHAPKFESPWIAFLFIFNTYMIDLGLKVAELRVTRPGAAARG